MGVALTGRKENEITAGKQRADDEPRGYAPPKAP